MMELQIILKIDAASEKDDTERWWNYRSLCFRIALHTKIEEGVHGHHQYQSSLVVSAAQKPAAVFFKNI